MATRAPVPPEDVKPPDGHEGVQCPHCHKSFWHKIGSGVKSFAVGVVDAAANVAASAGKIGGDE